MGRTVELCVQGISILPPKMSAVQCFDDHRLGGTTREISFLTVLKAAEIRVLACLVSGESPLPGFQMVTFSLYPHMTFLLCTRGERASPGFSSCSYKVLLDQGSTLIMSINLNTSTKAPSPNTVTWGLRIQHINFERHKHFVYNFLPLDQQNSCPSQI